jgi:uncharacterized protein
LDLTLQLPGDHYSIRSVSARGIQIRDVFHNEPLIISADRLETGWPVDQAEGLELAHLEPIFRFEPEVVLIGTGSKQIFLAPELMMEFYRRNIGVEVMSTDAACRTFNVLVSEERRVTAALIPLESIS